MPKSRLVQLRVPEEMLRRIDRFVAEGMYRSRSDVLMDAARRFIERSAPSSPLESFIAAYVTGSLRPTKEASRNVGRLFERVRKNRALRVQLGATPEEVMRKVRSRIA